MSPMAVANENAILRHDLEVCEAWIDALEAANARFREHHASLYELLRSLRRALVGIAVCTRSGCHACNGIAQSWVDVLQRLEDEARRYDYAEAQSPSAQIPKAVAIAHHTPRA